MWEIQLQKLPTLSGFVDGVSLLRGGEDYSCRQSQVEVSCNGPA